jgi:putative spermidine/putrescine transport system substrate-binding protein
MKNLTRSRSVRGTLGLAVIAILSGCAGSTASPAPATHGASASPPATATAAASTPSPAALTPSPAASTSSPAAATDVVIEGGTGNFADCLRTSYYDPYTSATGITVLEAPEDDGIARPKLAVDTGVYQVDVDFVSEAELVQKNGPDILEPIDYNLVPKDEIIPGLALDYGVGVNPNALVVGYNEAFLPEGGQKPAGIADFFDLQKFPGKRAIFEFLEAHTIALALLADGVPVDQLVPFDYDRAFAKLDTIKDQLIFAQSGTDARSLMDSGEAPIEITFASRVKESIDAGESAGIGWDGFSLFSDFMVIPKGDPNRDTAMNLVAFISSKEVSGNMSNCVAIGPANTQAAVNPDVKDFLPTSHLDQPHVVLTTPESLQWTTEHSEEIFNKFQEWRTT